MDHLPVPYYSLLQRTTIKDRQYIRECNRFQISAAISHYSICLSKEWVQGCVCAEYKVHITSELHACLHVSLWVCCYEYSEDNSVFTERKEGYGWSCCLFLTRLLSDVWSAWAAVFGTMRVWILSTKQHKSVRPGCSIDWTSKREGHVKSHQVGMKEERKEWKTKSWCSEWNV